MTTTFPDTRIINLSSIYGEKQNSSLHSIIDFEFPSLVDHTKEVAYVEVGIISAEIPVSFYTINEYNNTLRIIFNSVTFNMELVKGNYNATTLITEIRTKIDLAITGTAPITISLNRINGKLVWTNTSAIEDFTLVKEGSSLWYVLGLDDSVATYDANPTITPPFPLNLLGTNNISIRTDNLATYNYSSKDSGFSNTLANISVDSAPFGILLYKNTSITYNILRVLDVNRFRISMLDDNNNPIDFNNGNWSISLALSIHRHRPDRPTNNTRTFSDMLDLKEPVKEEPKKEVTKKEVIPPRPKTLKDLDILANLRFNN